MDVSWLDGLPWLDFPTRNPPAARMAQAEDHEVLQADAYAERMQDPIAASRVAWYFDSSGKRKRRSSV